MTGGQPFALNPAPVTSPIGLIKLKRGGQTEIEQLLRDTEVKLDPTWVQYFSATQPPGGVATGTATERTTASAASFPGWFFYVTDRTVFYISRTAKGTVNTNGTTVTWEGGDLFSGTWAGRAIVINGLSYSVSSVAANGQTLTLAATAGAQTGAPYTMATYNWYFAGGQMTAVVASLPADLTALDVDFAAFLPEYNHLLYWTGWAWSFKLEPSGVLQMAFAAPYTHTGTVDTNGTAVTWKTGAKFNPAWGTLNRIRINGVWYGISSYTDLLHLVLASSAGVQAGVAFQFAIGWHFCDGKGDNNVAAGNVSRLLADGTAAVSAVPDLTASPFFKGSTAAGAATDAAVAPTFTGALATENAHTHDVDIAPFNSSDNNNTVLRAAGAEDTQEVIHHHVIDPPNTTSSAGTAHTHGLGTLAITATATPLAYAVQPWLRK